MKILLLAGEASGVLYADQIRAALPGHDFRTYADAGFKTEDLAVMGFFAVLRRLPFFLRVRRTMERLIDTWRPDVVCTVDYPGLNLRLAAYAKARGIRAVHVVCPQVWAWKQGRIPRIEAAISHLCCFFPFEPALFSPGFATFVGHPLVDAFVALPPPARTTSSRPLLALLPGSRLAEIRHILPTLWAVARNLPCDVMIPAASPRAYELISRLVPSANIQLGGARELLRTADCAVVASGTATLEAALAHCPTILVYRVNPLLAFLARRLITGVRHIGLANIIAEKASLPCPMPELLQQDFTPANLHASLLPLLTDPAARADASAALVRTLQSLSSGGDAIERIAAIVINSTCTQQS